MWEKQMICTLLVFGQSLFAMATSKTTVDFEGVQIEGEIKNPGEFYFQHRPEDKSDSWIKRRKNFHREILRDVVLSK